MAYGTLSGAYKKRTRTGYDKSKQRSNPRGKGSRVFGEAGKLRGTENALTRGQGKKRGLRGEAKLARKQAKREKRDLKKEYKRRMRQSRKPGKRFK